MGNTTTHTHYTTPNTSSPPHPATPHDPNPNALSNTSHTPNSSPPHAKPSPNSHAPNTPTPTTTPNRYDRHCQRYFNPDATFHHLCPHTRHAVPTHHPYCVALDGTTVPRTGTYIPGAH